MSDKERFEATGSNKDRPVVLQAEYQSPYPIFGEYYIEVDYMGRHFHGAHIFEAVGWDERFGGCGVIGQIYEDGDDTGTYQIIDMPWKHVAQDDLDNDFTG